MGESVYKIIELVGTSTESWEAAAKKAGISDKDRVRIESQAGAIEVEAKTTLGILPDVLQIGHGWDDPNVNLLTDDWDLDPISGYPNMKMVAVGVAKINGNI